MAMNRKSGLYSLLVTAILLAVGIVLPFLTGNVQVLGQAISPLHIPVLICGLTCGWCWGMGLGIVLPLLRSVLFGMPPLVPVAIPMAFEMAAYGALCGLLYPMLSKKMSKTCWAMLIAMVIAMLAGRLVGGAAKAVVMGIQGNAYTFPAFVTAYFVNTAVGAVIHLLVVPLVVTALEKARLSPLGLKAKTAGSQKGTGQGASKKRPLTRFCVCAQQEAQLRICFLRLCAYPFNRLLIFKKPMPQRIATTPIAAKDRPMSPKPMVEATSAKMPTIISIIPMNIMIYSPYCTLK